MKFVEYVMQFDMVGDDFPYFHTTDNYKFANILLENQLKTTECDFFHEKLLYFFFGRPSYKISGDIPSRGDKFYLPVCFIVKPTSINNVRHISPFDTGAFFLKLFGDCLHKDMLLDDFMLGNDLTIIKRAITAFFGSCANYYHGRSGSLLKRPGNTDHCAAAYLSIINATNSRSFDERAHTIEIAVDQDFDITNNINAIILPEDYLADSTLIEKIENEWGAEVITYVSVANTPPSEYNGVIRQKAFEYLQRRKLI